MLEARWALVCPLSAGGTSALLALRKGFGLLHLKKRTCYLVLHLPPFGRTIILPRPSHLLS